jgi:hypothetical protein
VSKDLVTRSEPTIKNVITTLAAMSELFNRTMSPEAIELLLSDLEAYTPAQILKALAKCRRELSRFPTMSDIASRIDDGRPGSEEAWAMIPKDEMRSVVWTTEMQRAYSVAAPLIDQDKVAARIAFKEAYEREVSEARLNAEPVVWEASFGQDKNHRQTVLIEAMQKARLPVDEVAGLLPEIKITPQFQKTAIALGAPVERMQLGYDNSAIKQLIDQTFKSPEKEP